MYLRIPSVYKHTHSRAHMPIRARVHTHTHTHFPLPSTSLIVTVISKVSTKHKFTQLSTPPEQWFSRSKTILHYSWSTLAEEGKSHCRI